MNNNYPKLRFPEFSGEWKVKTLGDLLTFKNGLNAPKHAYGSGYKFINVLDIINNDFIVHDGILGKVNVLENEYKNNIVEYGDILFQRSSETREEVGQANVYLDKTKPATFGGFVIRGKKSGEYDPIFMNHILKTSKARKEITSRSGGSTRYNIGQDSLSETEILLPSLEEQQKIAGFLTAVDDRISAMQKKVELLKKYKKGVMQKIFSQEIRFRDDDRKDYPAWIETKVGDVYKERQERYEEGLDLLSVTMNDGIKKRADIGGKDNSSSDKYNYKRVYKGDIVYNSMRMWQGASGVTDYNGVVSPAYTVLERNNSHVSKFFGYYFKLPKMIHTFERYSQGLTSDTWNLKYPQISKIKIIIPSAKEQRKIADFLIAIDDKIQLEERRLAEAKKFKKSLLQQMFV